TCSPSSASPRRPATPTRTPSSSARIPTCARSCSSAERLDELPNSLQDALGAGRAGQRTDGEHTTVKPRRIPMGRAAKYGGLAGFLVLLATGMAGAAEIKAQDNSPLR